MEITTVMLEGKEIALTIRRNIRARRISLRFSAAKESIVMTLPKRTALEKGMAFLTSKAQWILSNIETNESIIFEGGAMIPILGVTYHICHTEGRGIARLDTDRLQLIIYGNKEFVARRVKDFLKKYLLSECNRLAQPMASSLKRTIRSIKIRDTHSRWGSCSKEGNLMFSRYLVFAPMNIITYLVAHEVAHLQEMNHSEKYWKIVFTLCPEYEKARTWLTKNGHTLYRHR
jgi:predicted metal-dependent hydrolase